MKKIIVLSVFVLATTISVAQVTEDGSFKMGSGQAVHLSKLIIQGPNQPSGIGSRREISFEFAAAGNASIRSYRGSSWDTYLQFLTTHYIEETPEVRLHIKGDGNIGIGTENPQAKLVLC